MKPSYMSDSEFQQWKDGRGMQIGELSIQPKRDFGSTGFLIDGETVKCGWVVCKGIVNVIPGAMWAKTIAQAKQMMGAYIVASQGGKMVAGVRTANADVYYGLMMLTRTSD